MNGLISIIIPVYNVKEYLERCVKSVIGQTYKNLEIILVDDGSIDGSSQLCDELQLQDYRIFVIHKENGGAVSARRTGLEKASGEYTILIDSDDWIEPNMVYELYNIAVKYSADIVTSGFYRDHNNISSICIDDIEEGIYSDRDDKEYIYRNLMLNIDLKHYDYGVIPSLWCKLIKTFLIRQVHEELSNEIVYGEDAAASYICCIRATKIVVTHKVFYHYILRNGSTVRSSNLNYFKNVNELFIFLKNEYSKSIYKSILLKQLDLYIIKMVLLGVSRIAGFSINTSIPYYDFDKRILKKGTKILLYGAGNIGKDFYKQICADKLYQLVGWVDENYRYYQGQGLNVLEVGKIKFLKYDYIILAFKDRKLADSVKKNLIKKYTIDDNKIIWMEPICIIDKYLLNSKII